MPLFRPRPDRSSLLDHLTDTFRTDDILSVRIKGIELVHIRPDERRPYSVLVTIGISPLAPYELCMSLEPGWNLDSDEGNWPIALLGTFAKAHENVRPFVTVDLPYDCGPYSTVYFVPSSLTPCITKRGQVEFLSCLPITPDERDYKITRRSMNDLWDLVTTQESLRDPRITKMTRDSYLTELE